VLTEAGAALADAKPVPFWLDSPQRPEPEPPLTHDAACDMAVVGAGFTGLWTALRRTLDRVGLGFDS
jgi:hypothetical protein